MDTRRIVKFQSVLAQCGIVASASEIRRVLAENPTIDKPNWFFIEAIKKAQKEAAQ
jgi:hypothetical protein